MESVTHNHYIAWCGALGCRRIAIIFEVEVPVGTLCGREGWLRVGGGQTHGANAVMVVGVIRGMSPKSKKKMGPTYFLPPVKAMAGPTDPLGTQSEVDSLSGVRAPRDKSGSGKTKQVPERRIRASRDGTGPCGSNQGPNDESEPHQNESGPAGRLRTNQGRYSRTNQGPRDEPESRA